MAILKIKQDVWTMLNRNDEDTTRPKAVDWMKANYEIEITRW